MNINKMLAPEINRIVGDYSGKASIFIKDFNDGEIFALNQNEVLPIASVIKIMILWELFCRVEENHISLYERRQLNDAVKTHSEGVMVGGSGVLKNCLNGLEPTIFDLAMLMITQSDNVATGMLIDELEMDRINQRAGLLGMKDTILKHKPYGVKQQKGFNNLSTACDIALLLEHCLESGELSSDSRKMIVEILKKQQIRTKLPGFLPPEFVLAHKTGTLPGVDHDAGIFELNGRKIIAVVLTTGNKDNQTGVLFCRRIGKLIYDIL